VQAQILPPPIGLEQRYQSLERRMKELEKLIHDLPFDVKIVQTRNVKPEEADRLVEDYLAMSKTAYPSDIAEALGISLSDAISALERLEKEGTVRAR
jgi:DNA-binding MarR family transcriptional regulator